MQIEVKVELYEQADKTSEGPTVFEIVKLSIKKKLVYTYLVSCRMYDRDFLKNEIIYECEIFKIIIGSHQGDSLNVQLMMRLTMVAMLRALRVIEQI